MRSDHRFLGRTLRTTCQLREAGEKRRANLSADADRKTAWRQNGRGGELARRTLRRQRCLQPLDVGFGRACLTIGVAAVVETPPHAVGFLRPAGDEMSDGVTLRRNGL